MSRSDDFVGRENARFEIDTSGEAVEKIEMAQLEEISNNEQQSEEYGDAPEAQKYIENKKREEEEQAKLPYKWSQTLDEISVIVPMPAGTKAKDLNVQIKKDFLSVSLKGAKDLIMGGDMPHPIKLESSTWTIESGTIMIELTKLTGQQWWPHVIVTDPKIDTKQIQPENSKLSDLDGETRGMVEKMMFDNQQKQMGKPTSDELKKYEMFEKFKKANPNMDFSNAKLS